VVSSAARRRGAAPTPATDTEEQEFPTELEELQPLVAEADAEFERLLEQEEEIERASREQHETPHFRPGDAD